MSGTDLAHSHAVNNALMFVSELGIRAFKRHVGLVRPVRGDTLGPPLRIGVKGEPDIQGIMNGGWYFACEVKTGSASRTKEQVSFGEMIVRMRGCYVLAKFADPHVTLSDGLRDIQDGVNYYLGMASAVQLL